MGETVFMKISDEIISMIIESKSTPAPVAGTSNLYTDLGFDSLAFVYLLVNIEKTYSISIHFMEMEMCLQVDKLISLVESKVKEDAGHDSPSADKSEEIG